MKFIQNLTNMEKILVTILGLLVFVCGCLVTGNFMFRKSPTPSPESSTLPVYRVSDVSDNGKTNVAYFLVADKNLTEDGANKIIQKYNDIHIKQKGYKLINIWIFCDNKYANYNVLDLFTDNEFYSHVMYWFQAGEWSSAGMIFETGPTEGYPAFGNACR